MEGEHAQMWQIPCKMTNSSSKPLQTLGKWYQPTRNPKKNPKPAQKKNPKTISHPFYIHESDLWLVGIFHISPQAAGWSFGHWIPCLPRGWW